MQTDWNATTGIGVLLNNPSLAYIDPRASVYGGLTNPTDDNSVALQAAISATFAAGLPIFIPPTGDPTHPCWNHATTLIMYSPSLVNSNRAATSVIGVGGFVNGAPSTSPVSCLQYTGTGTAIEYYDGSHTTYGGNNQWKGVGSVCGNVGNCVKGFDLSHTDSMVFDDAGTFPGIGNTGYGNGYIFATD